MNPPKNFLQNFGSINTGGVDSKVDWVGSHHNWGHLTASLQATLVTEYKAIDNFGNVSQRQVNVEVTDSAIPRLRSNAQLGWGRDDWTLNWILRYIDSVKEACANAPISAVPGCSNGETWHAMKAVLYHDAQAEWTNALTVKGLRLALGINNLFGQNPPVCYTCTLNGYDAGTYDLPGAFWNARFKYAF